MSEIFFYHITRTPLELTLGELLEKTMARGWRALVRSCSEEMLLRLDAQLWLRGDTGFMAHGLAGGAHDADQPILLSSQAGNPNRADILFALGNTPIDPGE
ncbi:MAG: DNA polymerase III subunit chi, partial [Paracoccaceae bacterium]